MNLTFPVEGLGWEGDDIVFGSRSSHGMQDVQGRPVGQCLWVGAVGVDAQLFVKVHLRRRKVMMERIGYYEVAAGLTEFRECDM